MTFLMGWAWIITEINIKGIMRPKKNWNRIRYKCKTQEYLYTLSLMLMTYKIEFTFLHVRESTKSLCDIQSFVSY